MYKFDYHLHSQFSADSEMSLDEICQKAIKMDLDEIAVTDHHDLDYQDSEIDFIIEKENYLREIEKYQQKYQDQLKIKKGIELGLQPHILKQCSSYLNQDFDFVIASFHTVEKKDLYNGDFFENYQQWEAYLKYLENVLKIVKEYDDYSVIGHLDIIRRYGDFKKQPELLKNKQAEELIREILKEVIKKDRGLEVNTSGYRIDGKNPLPSFKILEIYYQLGGRILTIGSDSHSPKSIANKFAPTRERLKEIGFKELTTFSARKAVFHQL